MRELTNEEQRVKVVMEGIFIPALHDVLKKANPAEYEKWQGNACRQTAVFGTVYLRNALPNYIWTAWDGVFDDIVHGQKVNYNHAWITGRHRTYDIRLLVDLSRQHHERLFIPVTSNSYPKDHPEYQHMTILERTTIEVDKSMEEAEFYSKLPSKKLFDMVVKKMNDYL